MENTVNEIKKEHRFQKFMSVLRVHVQKAQVGATQERAIDDTRTNVDIVSETSDKASAEAEKKGTSEAHAKAAPLAHKASVAQSAHGDSERAKHYRQMENYHKDKAQSLKADSGDFNKLDNPRATHDAMLKVHRTGGKLFKG